MKGSLHLATVAGIPVKIHWTFGLLLAWIAWQTGSDGGFQPWLILVSIGLVLSVFFCVILHEFGHALAARRFGVKTYDIVMTPIGGIARLERMPEGRGQEFWVAIAGPSVNFLIIGLIWLGFLLIRGTALPLFDRGFWNPDEAQFSYFKVLLLANGYLGMFNLLPAFPMDGGRMLRSLLSLKMDRTRATRIASYAGQAIAVLMFGAGMMRGQPILALIGVFIFFAARQEYRVLLQQQKMLHTRASDLMSPVEHILFTGQSIEDARDAIAHHPAQAFVAWARPGIPAGYITREALLQTASGTGQAIDPLIVYTPVAVSPDLSAAQLYVLMQQHQLPLVLLFDQKDYIGIVYKSDMK